MLKAMHYFHSRRRAGECDGRCGNGKGVVGLDTERTVMLLAGFCKRVFDRVRREQPLRKDQRERQYRRKPTRPTQGMQGDGLVVSV